MALYAIAFLGSTPIGGPIIGWISQQYGPRVGFAIGGIATIVATAVAGWSLRPPPRRDGSAGTELVMPRRAA